MRVRGVWIVFFLCLLIQGCGPSQKEVEEAVEAVAQGLEAISIEPQDIIDGVDGNTSTFAIESEEEDILITCDITLVNPRYMRMNTFWTFDDFLAAGSTYAVSGSVALHINGNVDMSSYAGKGTFDLGFRGGPVERLYMVYKETNAMGSIMEFKANDKEVRYLDLGPIGRRMEKAFQRVMVE